MQFRNSLLCSNISLILSAGVLLSQAPAALAQADSTQNQGRATAQWSCSADSTGNWQCSENPAAARSAPPGVVTRAQGSTTREGSREQVDSTSAAAQWVSPERMTPEQRAALPDNCCGGFIEPERQGLDGQPVDPEADPAQSPTLFSAPGDIEQSDARIVNIDGNVSIQQGNRTVSNTVSTSIDQAADTLVLNGDVVFREPGVMLTGSAAFVDQANSLNRVEQADYILYQYNVHGSADVLVYDSEGEVLSIENGEFSRCEPGNEFWTLRSRRMQLDTVAGIGRATGVTLRIKDVPVFHYPFTVPFPLGDQRMSGFLAPSIGSTSDGGFDFELPYYFNLAPHYDATLAPRFIAERGVMASGEFRYLADWSMNTVNASMLAQDDLYDPATAGVPGSDSPPQEKRWFFNFEHDGRIGNYWSTRVNYEAISDIDYFRDLGSSGLNISSRTHLERDGQLNFRSDHWSGGVRAQRIEIIDPFIAATDLNRPYDRLPELTLGNRYSLGGLEFGFNTSHVSFDRSLDESLLSQTQLDNGALVTGTRLHVEPQISFPIRGAAGFFVPTAKYKYTQWELEDQALGTVDNPDRGIGVFSLDSGLVFERSARNGFTQTLEPRLFYLYSEQKDQSMLPTFDTAQLNFSFAQLFRDDRFSGHDRVGDANQLSVALSTRFLDRNGSERARLGIGQIIHFEDRIVSLDSLLQQWITLQPRHTDRSPIVAEAAYRFSDSWQFLSDVQWNEEQERVDEGSLSFRYHADSNHIFNIGYRYRLLVDLHGQATNGIDPRIKQTDVSGIWPLNNNWRLLGRWNYDHSNSRNLDTFAGVEYSNCCTTIRLVAREWIDEDEFFLLQDETNRGVFFQLTLNGFGNISGGGVSSLLSDGILGFREYE